VHMTHVLSSPWPCYTAEEIDAVRRVMQSNQVNYWTGVECREFEREFATWVGTPYAVALANGTLALELALRVLGIGPGDEVVVTPRTFIASVSCVVNVGATPVFADVDRDSGNISADTIARVLTVKTRAVVCVHLAGWPCDMDPIMRLAGQRGLKIVEDCAQAHGARYKGRSVGSIGHIGAWSFCQDKIITTAGEGGMVTTSDERLWRAMWAYKDHGKSYHAVNETVHTAGFRWLHESFGSNYRMMELQAAVGRIQLRKMPQWTKLRDENARILANALRPYAGQRGFLRLPKWKCSEVCDRCDREPEAQTRCAHAWYKFYVYVTPENLRGEWTRNRLIEKITAKGVPCFHGTCPEVYLEKAFDESNVRTIPRLPVARELGETSLVFLVHPTISRGEMTRNINILKEIFDEVVRTC
jgi:dTDP-4-amino-4,6-dideoxygalactose transaminase